MDGLGGRGEWDFNDGDFQVWTCNDDDDYDDGGGDGGGFS